MSTNTGPSFSFMNQSGGTTFNSQGSNQPSTMPFGNQNNTFNNAFQQPGGFSAFGSTFGSTLNTGTTNALNTKQSENIFAVSTSTAPNTTSGFNKLFETSTLGSSNNNPLGQGLSGSQNVFGSTNSVGFGTTQSQISNPFSQSNAGQNQSTFIQPSTFGQTSTIRQPSSFGNTSPFGQTTTSGQSSMIGPSSAFGQTLLGQLTCSQQPLFGQSPKLNQAPAGQSGSMHVTGSNLQTPQTIQLNIAGAASINDSTLQQSMDPRVHQVMQWAGNMSFRTTAMVREFMERFFALADATNRQSPEMVSFFWARTPVCVSAQALQRQCDELANTFGPNVVVKLNNMKKARSVMSDDVGFFYTQIAVGFDGLIKRLRDQCDFVNAFTDQIKEFHDHQTDWRVKFQELGVQKLKSLRNHQYELRSRTMALIATLTDQARQRQGVEMDMEDTVYLNLEYDKLERCMARSTNSLKNELAGLQARLNSIKLPDENKLAELKKADREHPYKLDVTKHWEEYLEIRSRLNSVQHEIRDRKIIL